MGPHAGQGHHLESWESKLLVSYVQSNRRSPKMTPAVTAYDLPRRRDLRFFFKCLMGTEFFLYTR